MMPPNEIAAWASAYVEAQMLQDIPGDHPLWWAIERFMLVDTSTLPEDCWAAILEILSRNPPQEVIGVLAAGPLEDLIRCHGPAFIERIETESRRNKVFRHLLGGVWQNTSPEIWARIQKSRGEAW